MNIPEQPRPESNAKRAATPATEAWERALLTFRTWVGPIQHRALQTARQRFFAFCQTRTNAPDFPKAAPMIAFGFLTRSAFEDAERKTDVYVRR